VLRRLLLFSLLIAAALVMPSAASADGLELNGSNQYADAGPDPTASQNTTARTWEAWVKTDVTNRRQLIATRYRHSGGEEPWWLELDNGAPRIAVQNTVGTNASRWADVGVADGQWHHVAAVWVPSTRLDMYVDGEPHNGTLDGTIPSSLDVGSASTTIRIGIGHFSGALYGPFDGSIDGVRYSTGARWQVTDTFTPEECPDADAATIGVWNFDETSGTTTASQGQITSPATLTGGATFGDGFSCGGDALRFDGVNDRVEAVADPAATQTTAARTWEAWVKTTSNAHQTIIGRFPTIGEAPWVLDMEDGIARIHVQDGDAHGARYASKTVNDGEWHHVAAVWVPGNRLDLYLDGRKSNGALGGGSVPASIAAAGSAPIRIGAGYDDGTLDNFFDGDLDSVRYSKSARYDADFTAKTCWDVDADTIALWSFDEETGATTASQGQLAADASLDGGVHWVSGLACEPGESGGSALALDGANHYVEANADPSASQSNVARTWEAWVKTSAAGRQVVMTRYRFLGSEQSWWIELNNGVPSITLGSGSSSTNRVANATVNDGQWHHIAAVWEPGSRLDLYVDGQLANGAIFGSVVSSMDVGSATTTIRIGIGHFGGNLWGPFNGAVDGVRYSLGARYTGSFTPDTHPDADAGTIGLWNFDEGSGTTAAVQGQMTTAATLVGGTWTTGPSSALTRPARARARRCPGLRAARRPES
jgi:hypothetical protein